MHTDAQTLRFSTEEGGGGCPVCRVEQLSASFPLKETRMYTYLPHSTTNQSTQKSSTLPKLLSFLLIRLFPFLSTVEC